MGTSFLVTRDQTGGTSKETKVCNISLGHTIYHFIPLLNLLSDEYLRAEYSAANIWSSAPWLIQLDICANYLRKSFWPSVWSGNNLRVLGIYICLFEQYEEEFFYNKVRPQGDVVVDVVGLWNKKSSEVRKGGALRERTKVYSKMII